MNYNTTMITTVSDLSEYLAARHPELADLRVKEVASTPKGECDIWNVYAADGSLLGCLEDDGNGYVWAPGCNGLNSASLDDNDDASDAFAYKIVLSFDDSITY